MFRKKDLPPTPTHSATPSEEPVKDIDLAKVNNDNALDSLESFVSPGDPELLFQKIKRIGQG